MRVAVVGGGFTGLSCAVDLIDKGVKVEVFEKSNQVGGLAAGICLNDKRWSLEKYYHHIFTNDSDIIMMAKKVGLPPTFYSPTTSSFIKGKTLRLDSPLSVLRFGEISVWARLRMGVGLALLKIIPNGIFLEKYKVAEILPQLIGQEGYQIVWEKLLKAKFGSKMEAVNMAWFWSRVAKRTKNLGYFEGGFENLAKKMREYVEKGGGKVFTKTELVATKKNIKKYDKIVITAPGPLVKSIIGKDVMPKIDYLWAQTLILELKTSLMNIYWLNILEKNWPFLVVVEHTNLIDKKNYNNKMIVYLGNYFEENSDQLKMNKEELLDLYTKYLKKINPSFSKNWIEKSYLYRSAFAQPVFPVNYSRSLNKMPKNYGKFLFANMGMVYPFDRGTNYAVKLGREVAKKCLI